MARPTFEDSEKRKQTFAALVAHDLREGGRKLVQKNVVRRARDADIDPERALRLSWDESFIAEVHRFRST